MLDKIKTNIKSILFSKQCKKSLFFMLFSFAIFSLGIDVTFAEAKSDEAKLISDVLSSFQYLAGIAGAVIGGLTAVISILLNPSWVNGTLFGISGHIKDVWVFVSNIVYLIFAIILIAISFMNIIGKGTGDMFELKTALPRFIVGVLIVPFSWFFVQFIISMASILTVSVYSWPMETFLPKLQSSTASIEWCTHWVMNIQGKMAEDTTSQEEKVKNGFFYCEKKETKTIKDILLTKNDDGSINIGGAMGIYTFGIMDLGSLDKLNKLNFEKDGMKSIFQLSAKVLFDVAFIMIYLVILVALFMSLFARVIVLWIYMMMSPMFGLLHFSSKFAGKSVDKFNIGQFIGLAMVPVYVAAALSFGLMFLLIIGEGGKTASFSDGDRAAQQAASAAGTPESYQLGVTKLTIMGSLADDKNTKSFLYGVAGGALGLLGYIMMKMFGLAFLWMAVMAALNQSKITAKVIEPIEKLGGDVGKMVMDAPKFIPIPGTSGLNDGKNMTAGGLFGGINQGMKLKMRGPETEASKFAQRFAGDEESKKLHSDIVAATGKGADKWKDVLQNHEERNLFREKERLATGLEAAGAKGAIDLKNAKDEKDLITKLTKINNDNMHLNGGKGLLGKRMENDTETRQVVGGGKDTGTSSTPVTPVIPVTPVTQTVTNNPVININTIGGTPGIKKGDSNNYSIEKPDDLQRYIKGQYGEGIITKKELKDILVKAGLSGEEDVTAIEGVITALEKDIPKYFKEEIKTDTKVKPTTEQKN